jgi:hypothetical protein
MTDCIINASSITLLSCLLSCLQYQGGYVTLKAHAPGTGPPFSTANCAYEDFVKKAWVQQVGSHHNWWATGITCR